MRRENRKPAAREWVAITSGDSGPVARRLPKRKRRLESDAEKLERIAGETLDRHLENEDTFRRLKPEIEE